MREGVDFKNQVGTNNYLLSREAFRVGSHLS